MLIHVSLMSLNRTFIILINCICIYLCLTFSTTIWLVVVGSYKLYTILVSR